MAQQPLSVVVITLNEEANIARCLRSVAWADERIVVDCGSSDRTVKFRPLKLWERRRQR